MSLEYTAVPEIETKYESVRDGFLSGATQDLDFRREQLRDLYYAIADHEEELKQALHEDLHRSPIELEVLELNQVLGEIKLAIDKLDSWAADIPISGDIRFVGRNVLRPTPYGVVLVLGPWNYPYLCTLVPIVSAIAAGNTVLFKPTEIAVHSTLVLQRVLAVLDPRVLQVVVGSVEEASFILDNLSFDKIMLTGSGRVGKIVAAAAARSLTPLTLELGGKSPAIVTASASLARAAKRLAWAKFVNAGQTCIAPDYAIVDDRVADLFVAELKRAIEQLYPDDRDLAHIVSDPLFKRASALVGSSKGTVWQHGGSDEFSRRFPPTIVDDVSVEDSLMQDELFGPILPIIRVKTADFCSEACALVRRHDHPLALYIFATRKAEQTALINGTRSGAVTINDAVMQGGSSVIPFGGVGPSGQGRYHGKYGFDEFTFERPVVNQPNWAESLLAARYPPYTAFNALLLRLVSRPLRPGFTRRGPVRPTFFARVLSLVTSKYAMLVFIAYLLVR